MKLRRASIGDADDTSTNLVVGAGGLTCSYCGGPFSEERFSLGDTVSCCMAECASGYLWYIEGCGTEEHQALEKRLGRKITLPPPPQDMTNWNPQEGEVDQTDMLVQRLVGLSVDDTRTASNELVSRDAAQLVKK